MLESSRHLILAPSSNLPGGTDSTWFHLLPSLELDTVVCVGVPPEAVTRLLESHARLVVAVEPGQSPDTASYLTECDLVVIAAASSDDLDHTLRSLAPLIEETPTVVLLKPHHSTGWRVSLGQQDPIRHTANFGGEDDSWFLIPIRRERGRTAKRINRAARLGAARIGRALPLGWSPTAQHASDLALFQPVPVDPAKPRGQGTLVRTRTSATRVPAYILELASRYGLDLHETSWSYGPARGFRSQKIVFMVEDRATGRQLVIKSTQEPRFNDRLAAEAGALEAIHEGQLNKGFAVPEILFSAEHAGLLLVAQSKLDGVPFRQVVQPQTDSHGWDAGIAAVTALGAATARPSTAGELAGALDRLVTSYRDVFNPPDWVAAELNAVTDRLREQPIPAVMQHGDPGVWNMLVDDGGQLGVLDWENTDRAGMPLWDLFVFARTFGIFMADAAGVRYGPGVFTRQLLEPGALQRALSAATKEYCSALGIGEEAVADLFILCWAQQAIREAATQPTPSWQLGRSNRYLEASLQTPFRLR